MRVIVSGAQCTGKTTLIDSIDPRYSGIVLKERIRELCRTTGLPHDMETNDFTQQTFFTQYLFELSKREQFISDRGMLDVVAYTNYFVMKGLCSLSTYTTMLDTYTLIVKDLKERNALPVYVYLPVEFNAVEDGFRCTDKAYRDYVNYAITETMARVGIEPIVLRGPKKIRTDMFNDILKSLEHHDLFNS